VQESCGFGFVLHRELLAAGAQSFLITPIALNGQRKTDKLDARALCLRLSRWLFMRPYLLGDLDDIRTSMRKAERAAALIYAHFKNEFGKPVDL